MTRLVTLLAFITLLFVFQTANGAKPAGEPPSATDSTTGDQRQLVSMPEETLELLRQDMLDHLAALNEIIGLLGENKPDAAAEVAETRMGKSSMGKHRGTGMGPGRYMPPEMRNLGWSMHESATEFSRVAGEGDSKAAYSALQKITTACVACHYSYRTP